MVAPRSHQCSCGWAWLPTMILLSISAVACGDGDASPVACRTAAPEAIHGSGIACRHSPCVLDVGVGHEHVCALVDGGQIYCWGTNRYGAIVPLENLSGPEDVTFPTLLGGVGPSVALAAANATSCALHAGGGGSCWGRGVWPEANPFAPTVLRDPHAKVALPPGTVNFGLGSTHTCVLDDRGTVSCQGYNDFSQLGYPTPGTDGSEAANRVAELSSKFETAIGGSQASAVALGNSTSCVLRCGGDAWCWGKKEPWLTGDSQISPAERELTLERIPYPEPLRSMQMATTYACVTGNSNDIACWGWLPLGPSGNPLRLVDSPVVISHWRNARDISVSDLVACAVLTEGSVECFGSNVAGQLIPGSPDTAAHAEPVRISGLVDVSRVSVGSNAACVIESSGRLLCWGHNVHGIGGRLQLPEFFEPTEPDW